LETEMNYPQNNYIFLATSLKHRCTTV